MKNKEFVAFDPDLDCSWSLKIALNADRASEMRHEMVEIVIAVFDAIQGFFKPTKVKVVVNDFQGDPTPLEVFEPGPSESDVIDITDKEGVELDKLKHHMLNNENGIRYTRLVEMTGETKVQLKGGEYWLSKESDRYRWWFRREAIERKPGNDLIELTIRHFRTLDRSESYYEVDLWTYTDLWFEDTEIGRQNKQRLRNIFTKITDELNVIDINYYSDTFDNERLRDIVSIS